MKEKISLTIDSGLIKKADSLIDGIGVRNRSQAIESLLRKGLSGDHIDSAIVLAGGSEKELRFGNTFKPLVNMEGAPILVSTIRALKKSGVTRVIIAAGLLTERIFELVGDGSEYGVTIVYIRDSEAGTAGAVRAASRYISGTFFVILADVYFDFDLGKMVDFHRANRHLATIAVSATALKDSKDSIEISGNTITGFRYEVGSERTHHVNAGIYLFEKDLLERFPRKGSIEKEVLPKLAREGALSGFVFSGSWKHLG